MKTKGDLTVCTTTNIIHLSTAQNKVINVLDTSTRSYMSNIFKDNNRSAV